MPVLCGFDRLTAMVSLVNTIIALVCRNHNMMQRILKQPSPLLSIYWSNMYVHMHACLC